MPVLPNRPPSCKHQNTLLTTLLIGMLLLSSLYYMMQPARSDDRKFQDAKEVPISEVTRGYADGDYAEILVKDNTVFITKTAKTYLTSSTGEETVSSLGWNDPKNPTVVNVENTEATNLFLSVLPDLL